jgi:ethanolamine utilization protein EutA
LSPLPPLLDSRGSVRLQPDDIPSGGLLLHDDLYEHSHVTDAEREEMARSIWRQETVEMNTVGIDIGSSTSHLLFARIQLQRQTQEHSSRFVVTSRQIVWRSPIRLTPFLPDGAIDATELGRFIHEAYHQAGFARRDIGSGAVILTGEAIKKRNARAIDELFAEEAGRFVCATAGHKLESTLAAHGSGAVKLSKQRSQCLLHVDMGGGTTKLALIDNGKIIGAGAFAVGGRLVAQDAAGAWTRIDEPARLVAQDLGLRLDPASLASVDERRRIAHRMAGIAMDYILGAPLDRLGASLQLTEPLLRVASPAAVSFSGGVSEYLFGREDREYGDIAKLLAEELRLQLAERLPVPVIDPGQGIRATVIGASQYTVQVSGKTIYLPDPGELPVYGVPVVRVGPDLSGNIDPKALSDAITAALKRMDLTPRSRMALAFSWMGNPEHARLEAAGKGIVHALGSNGHRDELLLLMIDGDVGKTFGHLLHEELGFSGKLISIDGVHLHELDFVDVGELYDPPGVVPVVIKSLLFS